MFKRIMIRTKSRSEKNSKQCARDSSNERASVLKQQQQKTPEQLRTCKEYDFLESKPEYFLWLCKNSRRWGPIENCCKMMSEVFAKQHTSGDHSASLLLAKKVREQLLQKDRWQNTVLHLICYQKAPYSVVKALLDALDSTPGGPVQLLTVTNDYEETPLISACKAGACRKVMKLLLSRGGPVVTYDQFGSSPFDALLNQYTLVQWVPVIQNRYTRLEDIKTKEELTVTDTRTTTKEHKVHQQLLEPQHDDDQRDCETIAPSASSTSAVDTLALSELVFSDEIGFNTPVFPYFWSIMEDVMRAAWSTSALLRNSDNEQDDGNQLEETGTTAYISHLHGAALIAEMLPIQISDMILRTHADCIQLSETIKPLHLALAAGVTTGSEGTSSSAKPSSSLRFPNVRKQRAYFLKRLIDMDPSVANSCMPRSEEEAPCEGGDGTSSTTAPRKRPRSVFCQAITTGTYWSLGGEFGGEEGPVRALFRYCPGAILVRDTETGLLPFMLAATAAASSSPSLSLRDEQRNAEEDDEPQEDENLQLDTIYNLLRSSPESITSHRLKKTI